MGYTRKQKRTIEIAKMVEDMGNKFKIKDKGVSSGNRLRRTVKDVENKKRDQMRREHKKGLR